MSGRNIKLSQACGGMIRYKQAAGKSDGTINDYRVTFKKLLSFFKDDPLRDNVFLLPKDLAGVHPSNIFSSVLA